MAAHQETADDYGRVQVLLNDRWRVAVCSDGVQYLLQRRGKKADTPFPWVSVSFCVAQSTLERCIREKVIREGAPVSGEALEAVRALPTRASLLARPRPSVGAA